MRVTVFGRLQSSSTPQNWRRPLPRIPFPQAAAEPQFLHLYFLARPAEPDLEALNALKTSSEAFAIVDQVFYLHAPQGIGRSKLAAGAEKHLGVAVTARNWRTANKVLQLAQKLEDTAGS